MICPVHKVEFILKPAGVSKRTGQPYNAFWACPTFGCREKPVGDAKGQVLNEAQADQVAINTESYKDEQIKRSYRIERQHSQEMAIRYLELKWKYETPTKGKLLLSEKLKLMINWFMKDLGGQD